MTGPALRLWLVQLYPLLFLLSSLGEILEIFHQLHESKTYADVDTEP